MDKFIFKISCNTITLTPLTKRKYCPFCNGKGWHQYDTCKDACELCVGFPKVSFKDSLTFALEDCSLNVCYFEKYFSESDMEKIYLVRDLMNEKDKNFELTNSKAYEDTPNWLERVNV